MSVDAQERVDPGRQRRTDEAMQLAEPMHDPRVGPRIVPIVVAVLIGLALIALLYLAPWG